MANARPDIPGISDINRLFDCSVCLQRYQRPRYLKCGHQFCEDCLTELTKKHDGYIDIMCPTCRKTTTLFCNLTAKDLPRPVLLIELQDKLGVLAMVGQGGIKTCDVCCTEGNVASTRCQDCARDLCEPCLARHQNISHFSTHHTLAITRELYCGDHPECIVTAYCVDCRTGVCLNCVLDTHGSHELKNITDMAQKTKEILRLCINSIESTPDNSEFIDQINSEIDNLHQKRESTKITVGNLKDSLHNFLALLTDFGEEMETSLEIEIRKLEEFETKLQEVRSSQTRQVDAARHLIDGASDFEVVVQGQELLDRDDLDKMTLSYTVQEPRVEGDLHNITSQVQECLNVCKVTYKTKTLAFSGKTPTSSQSKAAPTLKKMTEVQLKSGISSIYISTMMTQGSVVLYTEDKSLPFKVLEYGGNLQSQFGGRSHGPRQWPVSISMDTKRELYLEPCVGMVARYDLNGNEVDPIYVQGNLRGVAYFLQEDLYVVSDMASGQLTLVDPVYEVVIKQIDCQGQPWYICVGNQDGTQIIVVSDRGNHKVELFTTRGQHIKSYGSRGQGHGQLIRPWGVSRFLDDGIAVCDDGNDRLSCYWSEGAKPMWKCLLTKADLGARPKCVGFDEDKNLLFVATNGNKLITFEVTT